MWALVDVCVLTVTDMTNSSDTYGYRYDGYNRPRVVIRTGLMWALVDVCVLTVTDMTNSSDTYGFDVSFSWCLCADVCVLTVTDMTNSSDTYGFDVSFSWCLCADGYRYDQQ